MTKISLHLGIPQSTDSSEFRGPSASSSVFSHPPPLYINLYINKHTQNLPSHGSHGGRRPPQFLTLSHTNPQVFPLLLPEDPPRPPPPPRRRIPELRAQGEARPELVLLAEVPRAQRQVPELHLQNRRRQKPPPAPLRRLQVRRPQLRPQLRGRRRPPLRRLSADELRLPVARLAAVVDDHGLG